jgi:Fe-S oxidoreductase
MFGKILGKMNFGNTMYYPGCLTHHVLPGIESNYEKILKILDINFISLPEFNCCGSPVIHAGYDKDFEDLKNKNIDFFKKYSINKIITNCPACYKILSGYGLEVEHITQTVWGKVEKIKKKHEGKITYHDPCHLGRQSGIYDEPRNILKSIGFKVVEFPNSKEDSMCCGAGGGLKTNCPELSNKIARNTLKHVKTKKLVTPCPMCYAQFKENAPKGLEILEFSEVLI